MRASLAFTGQSVLTTQKPRTEKPTTKTQLGATQTKGLVQKTHLDPFLVSANAKKIAAQSEGRTQGKGTGFGLGLVSRRRFDASSGAAIVARDLKTLSTLLAKADRMSTDQMSEALSGLYDFGEKEMSARAEFLWSPAGAPYRAQINRLMDQLAKVHPEAQIKGFVMPHERDTSAMSDEDLRIRIATLQLAAQGVSTEEWSHEALLGRVPAKPRAALDEQYLSRIVQSRTQKLDFMAAWSHLAEAISAGDEAAGLAKRMLEDFGDREFGLKLYLMSLA